MLSNGSPMLHIACLGHTMLAPFEQSSFFKKWHPLNTVYGRRETEQYISGRYITAMSSCTRKNTSAIYLEISNVTLTAWFFCFMLRIVYMCLHYIAIIDINTAKARGNMI